MRERASCMCRACPRRRSRRSTTRCHTQRTDHPQGQSPDGDDADVTTAVEGVCFWGHAAQLLGEGTEPRLHSRKVASHSRINTHVRICSRRCAPHGVQAILLAFAAGLLIT